MDEFLNDIYTTVFKQWILNQKIENCRITEINDVFPTIKLENDYGYAVVRFYDNNIIELNVFVSSDSIFYLHFQLHYLNKAVHFFNEMVNCLINLYVDDKTKILLCCSGGLTTTYFANKLRNVNDLLDLGYEIDATGYVHLIDIGNKYDIILLAPQISYLITKVKSSFKDKLVLNIPSAVFAKYDARSVFQLIK